MHTCCMTSCLHAGAAEGGSQQAAAAAATQPANSVQHAAGCTTAVIDRSTVSLQGSTFMAQTTALSTASATAASADAGRPSADAAEADSRGPMDLWLGPPGHGSSPSQTWKQEEVQV